MAELLSFCHAWGPEPTPYPSQEGNSQDGDERSLPSCEGSVRFRSWKASAKVLPASCRQCFSPIGLPARCRQHSGVHGKLEDGQFAWGANGSNKRTVVCWPGVLSMTRSPPCKSARRLMIIS